MPTVTGTITSPSGTLHDPADRRLVFTVVDQAGTARVGYTATSEVVTPARVTADLAGAWSVTLLGNGDVVTDWGPSLYRVDESYNPDLRQPYTYYISVPSSGGPYAVAGLRVALPGASAPTLVGYLPLGGGTVTGPITLPGAPTIALHAATKAYVDAASGGGGGSYLAIANNLSDLASAGSARTNLGLGSAATRAIGTTAGTVPDGADARFTDTRTPTAGSVVNASVSASAAIALSKLATDPLARANHTGTQAASSISDFATTVSATAALKANNLSDLASAGSARTNLGLGGAAVLAVGISAGTVAAGDDGRLSDSRTPTAGSVVNASISASAAIAISKLAVDPTARANHNGTQVASTISDFATAVGTTALLKANNLSELASTASTARTNIGALASSVVPDVNAMFPPTYRVGRQPTGTVVTTLQSGHGYTQTGTGTSGLNDTTDFLTGSQSAWVQSGGGGVQCNLRKYASAIGDTTGKALRLKIKVDDMTYLDELTLVLGKNSIADAWKFSYTVGGANPYLTSGDWVNVVLSWANATVDGGTPLRTDITDVAFQVFDNNTGHNVKLHVQSLEIIPNGHASFPNGLVSICFDDSWAGPKTYGWNKLDSYGYPATLFLINEYIGTTNYLTVTDVRNRVDRYGWEAAAHAWTGANHASSQTGLTAAALDADLRTQRAALEALGFRGASGYAYPLGQFGLTSDAASTIAITRRYFSYARTTHNRTTEVLPPADPYRLRAISSISSFSGGNSASSLTTTTTGKIDKTKSEGAWLILVFHNIVSGSPASTSECSQTDFNSIIDKVNSAGMPVLTIEDALKAVSA